LAAHIVEWLTDDAKYQAKRTQLAELKARFGHCGASATAGAYILASMAGAQPARAAAA
jgi:hypothetical protein